MNRLRYPNRKRIGWTIAMDFGLTDDQLDLQKSFGSLFASYATSMVVRESEPLGFSAQLWHRLGDLGVPELASAASSGGSPATLSQLVVIAAEYGRRLAPVPLLETVVAARLLDRFDRPPAEGICTLALRPVTAGDPIELLAAGAIADSVVALVGDELVFAELAGDGEQGFVRNLGASPLANRTLAEEVTVLAQGTAAKEYHQRALDDWKVLLAAALVGAATEAHSMTVAYVKERRAFNVPIGWFQTVAHRLADAINDLDGAYLLVHKAAWAIDSGSTDAPKLASMAYAYTTRLTERVAAECLHLHGGIGYTMEHDIQLYFRRAKAWPLALGDPRDEFLRVATRLKLSGAGV
jgi:alkylation response protein AidB-like acyl-CoA dehydrogenase